MSDVDIDDIIFIHRDISGLLRERSTFETVERRFLNERRINDFIVGYWTEQEELTRFPDSLQYYTENVP